MLNNKFGEKAARKHGIPIPKEKTWLECVPFNVFAEAVCVMYDCQPNSDSEKEKLGLLKEGAEALFEEVMIEGIANLEEELARLSINAIDSANFSVVKGSPVQDLV